MPPKFKFTREQIVDAGFAIVRSKGWAGLSTRSLAEALGASSRPIYSFFKSITELEEAIVRRGVDLLYRCMIRERSGDPSAQQIHRTMDLADLRLDNSGALPEMHAALDRLLAASL